MTLSEVQMKHDFVNCLIKYIRRSGIVESDDNLLKFKSVNGGDILITNDTH